MNRREFVKVAALAAGAVVGRQSLAAATPKELRAMLMHLGWNMWSDIPVTAWGPYKTPEELACVCAADKVRTDFGVWRRVTEQMAKDGYNAIVIDLGEAMLYPSHPELAVNGSLDPDAMRKELARLRGLGLEPIPKLNFSTAHDTWLKQYERMISSKKYYEVCADVIRDVNEIFGTPRFFHLGYDEETVAHQARYGFSVVRQGELWWHDFKFFVSTVERAGSRPWIWSDFMWHHKKDFVARMPKSVLQSNWYYRADFDPNQKLPKGYDTYGPRAYLDLEEAGFDQVPCGSNWSCDENFPRTVEFARKNVAPSRLVGFLNAPWFFPEKKREAKLMDACRLGRQAWA